MADNAKQRVRDLLDLLPDDCTLQDVLYQLFVEQRIEAGVADADAGNVVPHGEVFERLEREWGLDGGSSGREQR